MSARIDVELTVRDLEEDEAVQLWQRLTLVAEGFLRDGREVAVTTYRFTDDDGDGVELLTGPPSDKADS